MHVRIYLNGPEFSDRQAWANSVDADQTAPLIRVYTLCHSVSIFWALDSMVKIQCHNFGNLLGCPNFYEFYGNTTSDWLMSSILWYHVRDLRSICNVVFHWLTPGSTLLTALVSGAKKCRFERLHMFKCVRMGNYFGNWYIMGFTVPNCIL